MEIKNFLIKQFYKNIYIKTKNRILYKTKYLNMKPEFCYLKQYF